MQWAILIPFLVLMLIKVGIGVYSSFRTRGLLLEGESFLDQYFLAGRSLGPWTLAFTYLATFASVGTFIGYPGFAYNFGMSVIMTGINQIAVVLLAMGLIAKRMAQIGKRINAVTFTDVLRTRFDHQLTSIVSSFVVITFYIGYLIAQTAGGAILLQIVAGVPYHLSLIIFAVVVITYTTFGGFRAVAITDTLQGALMLFGLVAVTIAVLVYAGGLEGLTQGLFEFDKDFVFGPGPNGWLPPQTLISYWILWVFMAVGMPTTAVRFMSFNSTKVLHRAMIIGTVAATIIYIPMFYLGATSRIIVGDIAPDLAIPTLYLTTLPPWLVGIVLAAPFAAIISTTDSMLLVASSAIVKDVYIKMINPDATEKIIRKLGVIATASVGIIAFALTFNPPALIATWVQFGSSGFTSAFFVPIIAALFWKRATTAGGLAAIFGGFAAYLIIDIFFKNPLGVLSFMWAMLISLALMIICSYATQPQDTKLLKMFFGKPESKEIAETSEIAE